MLGELTVRVSTHACGGAALGIGSLFLRLALLVGSVVVRFRRGGEVVRRQLKWFALSPQLPPIVLRGRRTCYRRRPVSWPRSGCCWVFVSLG